MAGRTVQAWTSGAWTTASPPPHGLTAPPPPATEAAATATATLGMMAAHVSKQYLFIWSPIFFLVSDDATTKNKLFRVQKKPHKVHRVQRRALNKMVRDLPACPPEDKCLTDWTGGLLTSFLGCTEDPAITDNDALMSCIGLSLSKDCHDCVCEALAEEGWFCP